MIIVCYVLILINSVCQGRRTVNYATFVNDDEEAAEAGYTKTQTELQKAILKNYDKRKRPIVDAYSPVMVTAFVHLTHVSVNQQEQTVTLAGIITMVLVATRPILTTNLIEIRVHLTERWADEFAVWDPNKFYGIKKITLNQWEIWTPDIKITNSVAGLGQYLEISKRSHVTLESISPKRSYVLVRPKFNIKVGCKFDYSAYPEDVQNCAMGLFTVQRMSDVRLNYAFEPIFNTWSQPMWYFQNQKRVERIYISDWNLANISYTKTYFMDGKEKSTLPGTAEEIDRTWTVLLVKLKLKRHAPYYITAMLLPAVISFIAVIASYFLPSPISAIYILLANFFLIDFFLEDLLSLLPPVIGGLPAIVHYVGLIIVLTTISIFLHYCFFILLESKENATGYAQNIVKLKHFLPRRLQGDVVGNSLVNQTTCSGTGLETNGVSWRTVVNISRIVVALVLLTIFVISTILLIF